MTAAWSIIIACGLLACVPGYAAAQPATKPVEGAPAAAQPSGTENAKRPEVKPLSIVLRERLEALNPGDAEAYFRLGEDVVAKAALPADLRLARELFVLSYELDRKQGGRRALMGAACVALADIAPLRQDRRWLMALARSADPRYAPPGWEKSGSRSVAPGVGLAAATAIGQARAGDGGAARLALANPEVLALLQAFDPQLAPGGNGVRAVQRAAEQWPCSECRNARVVRVAGSNPPRYRVCSTCEGNPGPKLSREELVAQLRVESWLLDGEQKTWAAQIAGDEGAPLHDPDPAELAPVFGVDPGKTVWRDGAWGLPDPK